MIYNCNVWSWLILPAFHRLCEESFVGPRPKLLHPWMSRIRNPWKCLHKKAMKKKEFTSVFVSHNDRISHLAEYFKVMLQRAYKNKFWKLAMEHSTAKASQSVFNLVSLTIWGQWREAADKHFPKHAIKNGPYPWTKIEA